MLYFEGHTQTGWWRVNMAMLYRWAGISVRRPFRGCKNSHLNIDRRMARILREIWVAWHIINFETAFFSSPNSSCDGCSLKTTQVTSPQFINRSRLNKS